jgi:hypothetical protein
MFRALAFLVALSVWLPAAASAATVGGTTTRGDDGETYGTMHYRSGHGIANRVTVQSVEDFSEFKVIERAEPLRAYGECRQVDRHSAICPWSELDVPIELDVASQADRVRIEGKVDALVHGGIGNDRLRGNGDELFGDGGKDRLIGGHSGFDRLHGGPGRDRVEGRGSNDEYPSDVFYDDETDAQAARDVYVAGKYARARISYASRTEPLRLDARASRMGPERDVVSDVKSITGGSGDDLLVGSGGPNWLEGGPGEDRLYGRGSADRLSGDDGDDLMDGGDGDDFLTEYTDGGAHGRDRFVGGPGADSIRSLDGRTRDQNEADTVSCDAADGPVDSDAADRLTGDCESVGGWDIAQFEMKTRPTLTDEGAKFAVSCGATESESYRGPDGYDHLRFRCRGSLALRGGSGEEFGSASFAFDVEPFNPVAGSVTVPLTPAGRQALQSGALVEVEATAQSADGWNFTPAGYRAVLGG